MKYTIIDFNKYTAQVILRIDDGTVYPDMSIDLPVDDNNRIPEGEELDTYLRGFVPVEYDLRIKKLQGKGVANPEAVVVEKLPEPVVELTAEDVRVSRNISLAESDWTQLNDVPISAEEKAAWAEYRQALRDLPEQEGFPDNVMWPTAPNVDLA